MIREVTEYKPVIVMIPARSAGILSLVWSNPETKPAAAPPKNPKRQATIGESP